MFMPVSDLNAFKATVERFIATNRIHASTRDLTNIYATVPAAYTCANMRAENLADVDFIVVDANDKPSTDPRAQALQRVLDYNKHETLFRSELTICFWGRNLLYKEQSLTDNTIGLRWLNPHLYALDLTSGDGLRGFRVNYSSLYDTVDENYLELDEVVYQHRPIDFHDDFDAISPAEVTFQHAGIQAETATTVLALFRNMAIPAAIAQPASDEEGIDQTWVDLLVRMLRNVVQGSANFGRTIISPKRWEWIQLQSRFDQVAFKEISEEAKEAIFMGFRVPMVLVLGGANYAEQEGARRFWLQNWLVPQARWYASTFTQQLAGEFGNFKIIADFSNVPSLKEDEATRTNTINAQVQGGYRSLYDAQKQAGIQPDAALDGIYVIGNIAYHRDQLKMLRGEPMPEQGAPAEGGDPTGITPQLRIDKPAEVDDSPRVLASRNSTRVDEAIYSELTTWERISSRKSRKDKPFDCRFTPVHIENFVREGLKQAADTSAMKAVFEGARVLASMKAIASTQQDFASAFNNVLEGARSSDYNRAQFQNQLRKVLRQYGTMAYRDGLIDGGVIDGELDDDDRAEIATLLSEQSSYIQDFGAALFVKDNVTAAQVSVKADLWWNKSVLPFYQKALVSADKNGMYLWTRTEGKDSCSTCIQLSGQVHRLKDYAKRGLLPRSQNLMCGGWECGCSISRVAERARGKFPTLIRRSAKHVDGEPASHIHEHEFEMWDILDGDTGDEFVYVGSEDGKVKADG